MKMTSDMLIKSRYRLPFLPDSEKVDYPLLRLRVAVLFPHNLFTIQLRRKESLQMIGDCGSGRQQFVAAFSPQGDNDQPSPIHEMATLATVRDCHEAAGGSTLVTIEGLNRVGIVDVAGSDQYSTVSIQHLELDGSDPKLHRGQMEAVLTMVDEITRLDPSYSAELVFLLKAIEDDPSLLADRTASFFHFPLEWKQQLLEAVDLQLRFGLLLGYLDRVLTHAGALRTVRDDRGADGKKNVYIPWQPPQVARKGFDVDEGQA